MFRFGIQSCNPANINITNILCKSSIPLFSICFSTSAKLVQNIPNESDQTIPTMEDILPVQFSDIASARLRIRDGIYDTPMKRSHFMSKLCGTNIYLKNESTQLTGSFKERGARNSLLLLTEEEKKKGVIAASAGNHALALAHHGQQLGIPVTCIMPIHAPIIKVHKCRGFGANVVLRGEHIVEAKEYALSSPQFEGMRYINGYDDPEIIAGAGTIGLEILDDLPNVDAVVVPIGGAGLIAGISLAIKSLRPDVEIIGVEPKFCPSYSAAIDAGYPVSCSVDPTLADGLAVPMVGEHAFPVARAHVDRVVQCDEKAVALGVLRLAENEKLIVEGGGAIGAAAMLPGEPLHDDDALKDKNVVIPLCGGNIDTSVLGRVIERGMAADGRLIRFNAIISDRPGGLAKFSGEIAELGGSIKDVWHERAWMHSDLTTVSTKFLIETSGKKHSDDIIDKLKKKGYQITWEQ